MNILVIDPGTECPGWAIGNDTGACFDAGVGAPALYEGPIMVVGERPVIYPHSPAAPNRILTLAVNFGEHMQRMRYADHLFGVEPRKWKGTCDPDVFCRRTYDTVRTKWRDSTIHKSIDAVPEKKRHNALDALALLWWAQERWVLGGLRSFEKFRHVPV